MCDAILHRGPDSEGHFESPADAIAIIDVAGGDQPFFSADGKVVLIHNGEIYNFRELRAELAGRGHVFRTRSDTEVALAAWLEWGDAAWSRLHGMFAIAIVDRRGA